jgi:hypothetical protein
MNPTPTMPILTIAVTPLFQIQSHCGFSWILQLVDAVDAFWTDIDDIYEDG